MTATAASAFKKAGIKLLNNLLDLLTSKTTWVAAAGVAADIASTGGTLTVAGKGMIVGKILQQALADHGKNRPHPKSDAPAS